jgi:hypothetical protein
MTSAASGADHFRRLADRVRRRGARGGQGQRRPAQAMTHADVRRRRVVHDPRDGKGVGARVALAVQPLVAPVLGGCSTHRAADGDAGAVALALGQGEAGLGEGFGGRDQRELREAIEQLALGIVVERGRIVGRDLGGHLRQKTSGVEVSDPPHAAAPRDDARPQRLRSQAERRDGADTSDRDPPHDRTFRTRSPRRRAG